jgi:integrase
MRQAFTKEEAGQILEAAGGDELEALWTLALTAGLRQGELLVYCQTNRRRLC